MSIVIKHKKSERGNRMSSFKMAFLLYFMSDKIRDHFRTQEVKIVIKMLSGHTTQSFTSSQLMEITQRRTLYLLSYLRQNDGVELSKATYINL